MFTMRQSCLKSTYDDPSRKSQHSIHSAFTELLLLLLLLLPGQP
jgi:hypothetical protein